MHVVVAAAGKTGRHVVESLLQSGEKVLGIVRKPDQADELRALGADAAIADVNDFLALTESFQGAASVYLLNPPAYDAADLFDAAARTHEIMIRAAENAKVGRIVALSSVGAQHTFGTGNILTTNDFESQLAKVSTSVTILRAANFIDNWAWVLPAVLEQGVLPSMYLPLDRRIASVASEDIGREAAALMCEGGARRRIIELHGPAEYSPNDAAESFSRALGRTISAFAVPRDNWVQTFLEQGMPDMTAHAFAEMYDGFNSGLIAFEGRHEDRRGSVTLNDVVLKMVGTAVKGIDQ